MSKRKNEFLKFIGLDFCLIFTGVGKCRGSRKGWTQGPALGSFDLDSNPPLVPLQLVNPWGLSPKRSYLCRELQQKPSVSPSYLLGLLHFFHVGPAAHHAAGQAGWGIDTVGSSLLQWWEWRVSTPAPSTSVGSPEKMFPMLPAFLALPVALNPRCQGACLMAKPSISPSFPCPRSPPPSQGFLASPPK